MDRGTDGQEGQMGWAQDGLADMRNRGTVGQTEGEVDRVREGPGDRRRGGIGVRETGGQVGQKGVWDRDTGGQEGQD